ncbi:RimJ/RimL family protein N-acetyltransferase [Silvibacterium bohemicum]|uniref:RimJ/RimL family protein N-acetyltransferase n=1 Tax=Silvibacterium bohemicum TaxID=1577686 RepID=A0A841K0Z0_9BACT|nr:GNAT family N-acetyltransferase [Silvibacterium bohemicum]MBB6147206.1 RimJ/RimL family protein N-acetyltransferase [Silvibacterium bohemicum]
MRAPIETDRLLLRPLTSADEPALAAILGDAETMLWYPHPLTRDEVGEWIERQLGRYENGSGLLGLVEKRTGELIGDCGAVWQDVEGVAELEIGYHVKRQLWNRGFATEAAKATIDDAFRRIGAGTVISMIRPGNGASRRVAEKNGLTLDRVVFWHDYQHCVYRLSKKRNEDE